MISAPSKPLKLKLAGHILYGETRLRTKGVCSAPFRSRDIRDKVRNGILTLFRDQLYFSTTKQRRTKSFGTHVHNTSNNTSTKLQLQRIKLHIEIINLKPVTPTTILLRAAYGHDLQRMRCSDVRRSVRSPYSARVTRCIDVLYVRLRM